MSQDGNNVGCLGEAIVSCNHAKLDQIPKGIPTEISELYLGVNDITSKESQRLEHLKSLPRLDLSNNKVSALSPYVFVSLTRLATLIVSYTKLQCFQDDAFRGLKNWHILSLHGS